MILLPIPEAVKIDEHNFPNKKTNNSTVYTFQDTFGDRKCLDGKSPLSRPEDALLRVNALRNILMIMINEPYGKIN